MFATCAQCDADVRTGDVYGAAATENGRRLLIRCSECGVEGSMFLTYEELTRLAAKQEAWEEEHETLSPHFAVSAPPSLPDTEILGRTLQGFRIELDELDRDFNIIVEDWKYQERWRPWTIQSETRELALVADIAGVS